MIAKQYRRELDLFRTIQSPYIVKFFGSVEETQKNEIKKYILVMELCERGSLDHYLKKNEQLFTFEEGVSFLADIANGYNFIFIYHCTTFYVLTFIKLT
jgi:serine/threonine protein kinase